MADSAATPTVSDIFARHETAVGYSLGDGKGAPFIEYWSSTWKDVIGNPDVSTYIVHQAGAYYRRDREYRGSVTSGGFDGHAFWYGTSNDTVFPATGFTRPYDVTESVVGSEGFDASMKAEYRRSTDSADVVRIQPKDGAEADVYFNKKTALIDRVVYDPEGYAVLVRYRDYRAEGPVTVAHTMQFYDTTRTMTEFDWNAQFDASEIAPPAQHRYLWLPSSGSTTVPFDFHGGIIFDASVNGQSARMLLDTDVAGIQLSEHFAKLASLKLPENASLIRASPTVGTIDVGNMHLRDVHVDVVNGNFRLPYEGVIGGDVFSKTVVTIDYDKGTVTFTDPATFHDDGTRPSFGFALDQGIPQMTVTADGKTDFPVTLAIGSMFRLGLSDLFMRAHPEIANSNGKYSGGTVAKLTIGPYSIPDVYAASQGFHERYSAIPIAAGSLGGTVLSLFNTIVDYPDRRIFLTPRVH